MDFDDITRKLGQFGKYQRTVFFLACLVGFPAAFNNMGIVFIAGVPGHWCNSPEIKNLNLTDDVMKNSTIPLVEKDEKMSYSTCARYVYEKDYEVWDTDDVTLVLSRDRTNTSIEECPHGWHYDDSIYTSTIVSQWDLVCDDKWLQATAASVYMAGLMVGVLVMGTLSDLFGRRPVFIAGLLGSTVFSISVSFAPSYVAFCCLRFLTGFFTISLFTTGFVMAMELIGPDYRMHAGIIVEYYWAVGYMLYAGIAYFIRDWVKLNLVASCSLSVLIGLIFVIPESPRWLYNHGKNQQADTIIRKAAKVNKKELPEKLEIDVKSQKNGYVWDLCRTPRMACRSFNIFFNWFVNSCVYYGLSLNTSNLGGNDFVNFAISGGVEIPAYILCQVALHYSGRRWPLCVTMVGAGVALLCTLAVPSHLNWVSVTLAMIGKFGISASFAIIYVFTAEMYPTIVRNQGVAAGSFFARIGGIVAPYIGQLSGISRLIPLIIFGAMSIAAGLLALAFPETKGRDLPETIEDGENFGMKLKEERNDVKGHVNHILYDQDINTYL